MSTRCSINFYDVGADTKRLCAKIYRHSDGYPEAVTKDLETFFQETEAQTRDSMYGTRFGDASFLAARFVVWQCHRMQQEAIAMTQAFARSMPSFKAPGGLLLDFVGIGIIQEDPTDLEYVYDVLCSDEKTRPQVVTERPKKKK